ncbi:MAG: 2,3-bisphosphoglycerate-independent phosphoglycerate mutase [Alphaproteobacteria bacterium]|nr:2,3-bisphosphoglycerate-independent phosphoglycerate mutase [Alphaproteobacteria bacterium]
MSAPQAQRPVMLVVLDGWGWRDDSADNAVRLAEPHTFERLWSHCPHAFLSASGKDVGLPEGQIGNSEVGHLNIGAGRVVMQELPRIGAAIADGSLAANPALGAFIAALRRSGGTCHLLGLVSPGGVHSHQDHAAALARLLDEAGVSVRVHAFMDGRDTPPRSGAEYMAKFRAALPQRTSIATVGGRYYAMDRDKRWDRVEKAYRALAEGEGPKFPDADSLIRDAYAHDTGDEFIVPAVVGDYRGMRDGDGLLCFNFRADRVREILSALLDPEFDGFARPRRIDFASALGMTEYSKELARRLGVLFPHETMPNLLGQVVAAAGRRQLRIAETEKYAHVTYFLNGGEERPNPGEDRIMVPSPKVPTYDQQPEMSAPEVTDKAVAAIESGTYDLIVLNFANPDMVGHTGSLPAAIKAVQTVDAGLGRIVAAIGRAGGALLVTADHGNCELMRDPATGGPHTAHTTNPVPVILVGVAGAALHDGILADIAPTLLELMGLSQPAEMTGHSLLHG